MDDLFKKLQNIMSGSINVAKKEEVEETEDRKLNEDLVNNFMEQILDVAWVEDELKNSVIPSYHLCKDEKSYWLMNVNLKMLMHIKSGVEIIPVEHGEKNTLCMIGTSMYSIPNELLICSGWN